MRDNRMISIGKRMSCLVFIFVLLVGCEKDKEEAEPDKTDEDEIVYDETGALYTSIDGLVMAGYQGWYAAEGDGSNRGWFHYTRPGHDLAPGFVGIDFWPDMSEYDVTHKSPFSFEDGSNAPLFSSFDESTVDTHFRWMKEYGIDGVYIQRFLSQARPEAQPFTNTVLENALKAAKKYDRAICIMYDLSGYTKEDLDFVVNDWNGLVSKYDLYDTAVNPTYLRHNKKPVLAIWGTGFSSKPHNSPADFQELVKTLKGPTNKNTILLGVPYYWRTLSSDAVRDPSLHDLIKSADIISPWAVGRYSSISSYGIARQNTLVGDIKWCEENDVDYIPVAFPGFSWKNLKQGDNVYNATPREGGKFFWAQVAGAKQSGAKALYVAMFDEMDEGTAIFKVLEQKDVPLNGEDTFVGIENGLGTDYYLWLTGQAANWFKGDSGYNDQKPAR